MLREMAALAALLVAAGPAWAQTGTTTTTTPDANTATAQPTTDAAGTDQGQVAPKPNTDTGASNTGGVTPQGKENLPDIGATTGVQPADGAASPPQPDTTYAVVDPGVVKEIRDAALAAQKAAAAAAPPPPQKTEEQKQAEAALIARHREAFEARVQERLKAIPQG